MRVFCGPSLQIIKPNNTEEYLVASDFIEALQWHSLYSLVY